VTADIGLFEAIYTARSMRRFKPDAVPPEVITRVLDAAIRASSGSNAQHWAFIVVRDAEKRRQLGALYRKASGYMSAVYATRPRPDHLTQAQYDRFLAGSGFLWDHMADAPVILVPCLMKRAPPERASLPEVVQARYADHGARPGPPPPETTPRAAGKHDRTEPYALDRSGHEYRRTCRQPKTWMDAGPGQGCMAAQRAPERPPARRSAEPRRHLCGHSRECLHAAGLHRRRPFLAGGSSKFATLLAPAVEKNCQ
jgi:nitroreductase